MRKVYTILSMIFVIIVLISCENTNEPAENGSFVIYTLQNSALEVTIDGETKVDNNIRFNIPSCDDPSVIKFSKPAGNSYEVTAKLLKTGQTVKRTLTFYSGCYTHEVFDLPQSIPSGGFIFSELINSTNNTATFKIKFFVVDKYGKFLSSLNHNNFLIKNAFFKMYRNGVPTGDSSFYEFSLDFVKSGSFTNVGPYSTSLLFDQSGSLFSTDPNHSRIDAAEIFLNSMEKQDFVQVSAFASNGLIPNDITNYGSFTNDANEYFDIIKSLKNLVGGGTPLYRALYETTDFVNNYAPTNNKAVVVFTDGEDTDGYYNIDQVIENANYNYVKIFTVGLGNSVQSAELALCALKTGGAYIQAYDARALVSAYGSLGNILRGYGILYEAVWKIKGDMSNMNYFSSNIIVDIPNSQNVYITFIVNF